jgi:integrase
VLIRLRSDRISLSHPNNPDGDLCCSRGESRSGVRRTFASRLNTIQKLMGHRHIGTTALYCDVSEDTLRNAVELV